MNCICMSPSTAEICLQMSSVCGFKTVCKWVKKFRVIVVYQSKYDYFFPACFEYVCPSKKISICNNDERLSLPRLGPSLSTSPVEVVQAYNNSDVS